MAHPGVFSFSWVTGQFLFLSSLGFAFFSPWLPVKKIGRGYHQWNLRILAVMTFLSVVFLQLETHWYLFALGFLVSAQFLGRSRIWNQVGKWAEWGVSVAWIVAATALAFASPSSQRWELVSSGFLLGCVLCAMIVGHWYLVAPGLSFGYLQKYTMAVLFMLALRAAVIFIHHPGVEVWLDVFWWARMGFGMLLPLVFTLMAYRTLHYRNNQAATGILYVVVVLIFMGELIHLGGFL